MFSYCFGTKRMSAVLHGADGRLGQRGDLHEPLIGQPRLDERFGTVAARHRVGVVFNTFQQAGGAHVHHHLLPRLEPVKAAVRRRRVVVHPRLGGEDVEERQAVARADGVVVEVVRRGDLHATGTELGINQLVRDDGMRRPTRGNTASRPISAR